MNTNNTDKTRLDNPIVVIPTQAAASAAENDTEPSPDPQRLAKSLAKYRARFEAVPEEALVQVTVDIAACAMLVLKRVPTWAAYRERIRSLPEVNHQAIDELEELAEATLQANADYLVAVIPQPELAELLQEATELREQLRSDAEVLVRRGLLPPGSLSELKGLSGYRHTAVELTALVTVFSKHWQDIAGKTAVTKQELDHGSLIAQKIFRNAAGRDARHPNQIEASRLRTQAFTLLSRAYDELRRCLGFLLSNAEDLEQIAPSFYQGRGGRPALRSETPSQNTQTPSTPAQSTQLGASASSSASVNPQNATVAPSRAADPNALPSKLPFAE